MNLAINVTSFLSISSLSNSEHRRTLIAALDTYPGGARVDKDYLVYPGAWSTAALAAIYMRRLGNRGRLSGRRGRRAAATLQLAVVGKIYLADLPQ